MCIFLKIWIIFQHLKIKRLYPHTQISHFWNISSQHGAQWLGLLSQPHVQWPPPTSPLWAHTAFQLCDLAAKTISPPLERAQSQIWLSAPAHPLASKHLLRSVHSLSRVWLFSTPWTAARQASLSITNSRSLLKLISTESVMPSNHLILCHPLLQGSKSPYSPSSK